MMLDGKHIKSKNEKGEEIFQYQPWSEAEIENFKEIVTSTVGINLIRGDQIIVKNMEFAPIDFDQRVTTPKEMTSQALVKNLGKYVVLGVFIFFFFIFLIRPLVRWITDNSTKISKSLRKIESDINFSQVGQIWEEQVRAEKEQRDILREKIISLIRDDPGKAAQTIRGTIKSDDSGGTRKI